MLRRLLRERTGLDYARHWRASRGAPDAVFLWIPKTAGMSVYHALRDHGCYRLKSPDAVRRSFPGRGLVTFKHMGYEELLAAGLVERSFDERSLKFCFSRNPYDRAVSLYFFLVKKEWYPSDLSFLDFWRTVTSQDLPSVGAHKLVGPGIANPQVHWIRDVKVDFVGRFESIALDFADLSERLGLGRIEIPWVNATKHEHWSTYYCDESKSLIERFYAPDFERFDYSTDIP